MFVATRATPIAIKRAIKSHDRLAVQLMRAARHHLREAAALERELAKLRAEREGATHDAR
jgi:hypothetical protein